MAQQANIFIPDISGFTEFLGKTELEHSSHIINELLKILVDSNSSDFTLLEVEGDALLFLRKGEPVPFDTMVEQCMTMFNNFHTRLRIIERDTVCRCGACQGASNLTLKFVIHYGLTSEIAVSSFVKASGIDMVIAHRLLKNRIDSNEYILATEQYLQLQKDTTSPTELSWTLSSEEYPVVGSVAFRYASLENIKTSIPPVPETAVGPICLCEESVSVEITVPMLAVYGVLSDLDGRKRWIGNITSSDGDDPLGRLHTRHYCYTGDGIVEVTPLERVVSESEIRYSEALKIIQGSSKIESIANFHLVRKQEGLTRIEVKVGSLSGAPIPAEMAGVLLETLAAALQGLKAFCESGIAAAVSH